MKMYKFSILIVVFCMGLFVSGCYYDEIPNIGSVDREVSFSADIIPIMNASCNQSGCHNTGGIPPDLSPGNAYNALNAIVDVNNPQQSELYAYLIGTESLMPPAGQLPNSEISLILAWIEQGALNN